MISLQVSALFRAALDGVMLTAGIHDAYVRSTETRSSRGDMTLLATGISSGQPGCAVPALYSVSAKTFRSDATLHEEVFGPCSLVIWCDDLAEMKELLSGLDGNLTATLHASAEEMTSVAPSLIPLLQANAGRVIINGFPTGVEAVSHAIVRATAGSASLALSAPLKIPFFLIRDLGARWPLPRAVGRQNDVCWFARNSSIRSARLLSKLPRCASAGRAQEQQSAAHHAPGEWNLFRRFIVRVCSLLQLK